ncbi:MAG: hypothetical protein WCF25_05725 [Acidimicrobiales bacterium]
MRKTILVLGTVLTFGLSSLTLSSAPASAATHHEPPDRSFCLPLVNNLETLRTISIMANVPLTATVANGPRMDTYLTNLLSDINDEIRIFNGDVTSARSSRRKALLRATIPELQEETTRVRAYSTAIERMIAAKNAHPLKLANVDVAVDANKSCLVWAQQLIHGFVMAEFTVGLAQDGPLPGDGPNDVATDADLVQESHGYGGLVTVKILNVSSKTGPLRSAKVAITESSYTVDICMTFSGHIHEHYEAFTALAC